MKVLDKVQVYVFALVFFTLGLGPSAAAAGFNPGQFLGHYEGFIFEKGQSAEGLEVTGEASLSGKNTLSISVQPQTQITAQGKTQTAQSGTFEIQTDGSGKVTVDTSTGEFEKADLSLLSKSTCYQTTDNSASPVVLQLCVNTGQISLNVSDKQGVSQFKLQLSILTQAETPVMEKPASYTLSQLMNRAKTRNFQTVIEFQNVIQARDESVNAYENLLPHFNTSDVLNIASMNALNIAKTVGDLAPFLLPDRWIRATQEKDSYLGAIEAWDVMDADGMNISEGLALSAIRESGAIAQLQNERDSVAEIRDEILAEENSGLVQVGTSGEVTLIVNSIDNDLLVLQEAQTEELSSLAQAAGFYNPRAILSVGFGPDQGALGYTIDNPVKTDVNSWINLVVARSPEMIQMNDFLAVAKEQKKATYFTWLDPSGDTNGGIGFGLPSYISIGKDEIAEVQAQSNQVKSILIQKISDVASLMDQNIQSYLLAQAAVDTANQDVQRIENNFRLGVNFQMSELVQALQDQEKANLDVINWESGYYTAFSRMNRLLYTGLYADIPFQNPTQGK
jgi:hypothetical protein